MLAAVLTFLALGVAAVYFTIAAFVVPRIQLPGASHLFSVLFTLGAISFFVGCGLSHLHIAVHAIEEPSAVRGHEIGFHVLQFVGGAFFIWAAFRFLNIRVEVKRTEDELRLGKLEELAIRDPLTGAYNRRYYEDQLGKAIARFRRESEPFAVAQLDVDDFKLVNDREGHGAGDAALKQLVRSVEEVIRPTDTVGRIGGDEFGLMLPGADSETALSVAERVRSSIASNPNGHAPITISVGIAACPEHAQSAEDLLSRSDEALYRSKREGKNRSRLAVRSAATDASAKSESALL